MNIKDLLCIPILTKEKTSPVPPVSANIENTIQTVVTNTITESVNTKYKCFICSTEETPLWRNLVIGDAQEPRTKFCNACGLRHIKKTQLTEEQKQESTRKREESIKKIEEFSLKGLDEFSKKNLFSATPEEKIKHKHYKKKTKCSVCFIKSNTVNRRIFGNKSASYCEPCANKQQEIFKAEALIHLITVNEVSETNESNGPARKKGKIYEILN